MIGEVASKEKMESVKAPARPIDKALDASIFS